MQNLSTNMKEAFYKCECGHGGLHVEYHEDWGCQISHYQYDVSRSWSNRFKFAWKCLQGKPYTDMVLLNDSQMADLTGQLLAFQNREV